ncbi:elongation factor P [Buchnera aphidicola (Mollitrichosiphum nigrofasciatum)]|uniref:elongation factor P n=1 Tax=Buchnera aphidicola TaxID=9 RepID=UPI0031B8690C
MKLSFSNNFKCGRKILYKSEPYLIEYSEFIKPGKGRAFVRLKLRRLLTGTLINITVKSSKLLPSANIVKRKYIYLFNDNIVWHFMDPKNLNQITIEKNIVANSKKWLLAEDTCKILLWNNKPISVILNNFVQIKVIKNSLKIQQDELLSNNKIVKLITNTLIKVPLFIQVGDIIKVDTRTETYVSRIR